VIFVGNATMLITAGDLTLLTDPNFLHRGQYAYLRHGIVSRRRHGPALTIDELPPIDAVVLSHLHGDHWDRVSQKGLDHGLPIITTPHAARGFEQAVGLSTWQTHTVSKGALTLTATSLPGRHAPGWAQRLTSVPTELGGSLRSSFSTTMATAGGDSRDVASPQVLRALIEVINMPRTREQLRQAAEDAERWLDSLDPAATGSPNADASRLRGIAEAVRAVAGSQVQLADAVAAARAHGHTWTQIAAMLGTSRQVAQERYGKPAERR
jgi:L-ascorbate metabolism protein UlaG (beta-lactamase superfamily)